MKSVYLLYHDESDGCEKYTLVSVVENKDIALSWRQLDNRNYFEQRFINTVFSDSLTPETLKLTAKLEKIFREYDKNL